MALIKSAKHSVRTILNQFFDEDTNTLTVGTSPTPPSTLMDGWKAIPTAGTRLQLATIATPAPRVTIQALDSNVGQIVIGGTTVVAALVNRTGVTLNSGDAYELDVDDLSKVFFDATVSGDGVSYVVTS